MSHSIFSAHRIVFGGIGHGFQNIRTVLRLAILPLVLIALIGGAIALMNVGTYEIIVLSLLLIFVLSLLLLFVMGYTLPITCIHFATSGEIGHNITGHTTKGFWKYFVASLKFTLILFVFSFLAGISKDAIIRIAPSFVASIFQLIIHLIIFYVTLRLVPMLIYSITEGTSSVRHTLRLTRHRVWFLLRCTILLALFNIIFYSLIFSVPVLTLFDQTLSIFTMDFKALKNDLLTNMTGGLLLLNVLWIMSLVIFHHFISTMVAARIANVLKKNPKTL